MADEKTRRDYRKIGLVLASCALALSGCGEKQEPRPPVAPEVVETPPTTTTAAEADRLPPKGEPTKPAEAPPGDPRVNALERQTERTVREYVAALNARDGNSVCAVLAPGALEEVELPVQRGGCTGSLSASIGYRDPRGLPVWQGAELTAVRLVEAGPEIIKMLATVVTQFADRDEPSVEDDVVYLVRVGSEWRVAKPSSTLYRAIGVADVPPSVLTPPDR